MLLSGGDDDGPLARLAVLDPSVAVQARSASAFAPASSGHSLAVGDTVRTDALGRAQVDYAEGSLTRLDRNTTFVVERLAEAERPDPLAVRVDLGRTWNEVAELTTSGERFQVSTSNAVATVRGTVFTVDHFADGTSVFAVEEGLVEVVTSTGARILLRAGDRVTVFPDGTLGPVQKVSFEDLSRVDEWIRFNLDFGQVRPTTTVGGAGPRRRRRPRSRPRPPRRPGWPTPPGGGGTTAPGSTAAAPGSTATTSGAAGADDHQSPARRR